MLIEGLAIAGISSGVAYVTSLLTAKSVNKVTLENFGETIATRATKAASDAAMAVVDRRWDREVAPAVANMTEEGLKLFRAMEGTRGQLAGQLAAVQAEARKVAETADGLGELKVDLAGLVQDVRAQQAKMDPTLQAAERAVVLAQQTGEVVNEQLKRLDAREARLQRLTGNVETTLSEGRDVLLQVHDSAREIVRQQSHLDRQQAMMRDLGTKAAQILERLEGSGSASAAQPATASRPKTQRQAKATTVAGPVLAGAPDPAAVAQQQPDPATAVQQPDPAAVNAA